ncbi:trypsin-3-like [Drosophila willistoni]|uniref:trypsin-3-like n=1 Tax=Drosophila willistoni TaxID=7260 RepID=UPI001F078664|nr:trypsin-3-like [Drosophila willistoni]XP_046866673.1 trypsin-3-like [Drosophila willistoni]
MDLLALFVIHQLILSNCLVVQGLAIEDVPYLAWVATQKEHKEHFGHGKVCAGTVISERVILSAAQCYYISTSHPARYMDAKFYIAVTGENHFGSLDRLTHEFPILQIVGHSDFNEQTMDNDVAVLFINGYIPRVWRNVKPVPLAESPPEIGEKCFLSGWADSGDIHQAELSIMDLETCRDTFPGIGNSQMCTAYKEVRGICLVDAGNPLVCSEKLTGILSMEHYCFHTAGTFTNISNHIDWIRKANSTFDYSLDIETLYLSSAIRKYQPLALFSALLILKICRLVS